MRELSIFPSRQAFRCWLEENCAQSEGIWLLFEKRRDSSALSANEALEEALCFGWIDGQMQRIDEHSYKKYFARRTPKSNWSDKNKKTAQALIDRGLMSHHGMKAIETAKQSGAWDTSTRNVISDEQVEELKRLLQTYDIAYNHFISMSPSIQRTYTGLYLDAKTEKTRQSRLERIVDRLNKNLKPM